MKTFFGTCPEGDHFYFTNEQEDIPHITCPNCKGELTLWWVGKQVEIDGLLMTVAEIKRHDVSPSPLRMSTWDDSPPVAIRIAGHMAARLVSDTSSGHIETTIVLAEWDRLLRY